MSRPPNRSPQTQRVLGVLLAARRSWRHGYHLAKETGLRSGTLYPILMRLAEQGLLDESWQPADVAGRPQRHMYRLTSAGVAAARELVREPASAGALKLSKAPSR